MVGRWATSTASTSEDDGESRLRTTRRSPPAQAPPSAGSTARGSSKSRGRARRFWSPSRDGTQRERVARSSGSSRCSTPVTSGSTSSAMPNETAPRAPLPLAVLAGTSRGGRDGRLRPLVVRNGFSSSGSSGSPPKQQWHQAYGEIVEFERSLVLEQTIVVKVLAPHLRRPKQLREVRIAGEGPVASLEADRR